VRSAVGGVSGMRRMVLVRDGAGVWLAARASSRSQAPQAYAIRIAFITIATTKHAAAVRPQRRVGLLNYRTENGAW
jgi:hypothetical protein